MVAPWPASAPPKASIMQRKGDPVGIFEYVETLERRLNVLERRLRALERRPAP